MNRLVSSVIGGQQYNTRYDAAGRVVEEWTKVEDLPEVQADAAPIAPIEPKRPVDPGPDAPQAAKDRYQALLTQYNIDYAAYQVALADYAEQQAEYGDQLSFIARLVKSKAKSGYERHAMSYDSVGRSAVTEGYNDDGSVKFRQTNNKYDAAGNVVESVSFSTVGDDMSQIYTSTYGAGVNGSVLLSSEGYMRGESGKLSGRTGATAKSVMVYNADGKMIAVNFEEPVSGASPKSGPKSKFFVLDAQGNILKAVEVDKNAPTQEQYQVIANGQLQLRYSRNYGDFGGDMTGEQKESFWRGYNLNASQNPLIDDPVTSNGTPANGGNVVVANDGDTLQTIAQRIYGDASLWYKLAEANKLQPGQALHGGQALTAPAYMSGVSLEQNFNNGKLVGSTMPNLPSPPPPKSRFGFLAKIVAIIVFVVVCVVTGGGAAGVALAAMSSALAEQHATNMLNGNFNFKRFVKRTVNPFSGNLKDFARTFYDPLGNGDHEYMDYKAVAKAGAIAFVSAGVGSYVSSAVGGAVTKGINSAMGVASSSVATAIGTQVGMFAASTLSTALTSEHFSWKAVAASYAAQNAGNYVSEQIGAYIGKDGSVLSGSLGKYAQKAIMSAAQNISYQVIKNDHVDWKAVGVSTLATVGNALIKNNVDLFGGKGSFGDYAAHGVLGGYLSERRGGNFIDGMVEGAGHQIMDDAINDPGVIFGGVFGSSVKKGPSFTEQVAAQKRQGIFGNDKTLDGTNGASAAASSSDGNADSEALKRFMSSYAKQQQRDDERHQARLEQIIEQKLAASEFEQGAALTVVEQNAVAPQRGAEQRFANGELVKFDGTGTVPIGQVTSSDFKLLGEERYVGGSRAATYAGFDGAGNLFTNASDTRGKYQFYGRPEGATATFQDVLDNATDPQQRLELLKYRFERWNVGAGEYAALGLDLNPGDPRFTEMQQRANGMRDAVGSFSLMTAGGVAGLMTGGLAFGAVRTLGAPLATSAWGAIGVTGAAGVSAGFVGDLTSQGIENVAYFASGKAIGHFGINKTELAFSAGFGLAPILPSVIRQTAAEARAVGMPDWNIAFTKPTSVRSVAETVQFERIGGSGSLVSSEIASGTRTPSIISTEIGGANSSLSPKFRGECFVAGTLVHTEEGTKVIEDVAVGDRVAARNEFTGETSWRAVKQLFTIDDKIIVNVTLRDSLGELERISATNEHPFFVQDERWRAAKDLLPGDQVVILKGGCAEVVSVEVDDERATAYNFEVADVHTYFVGTIGVWVHNSSVINWAEVKGANTALVNSEVSALERMAANNRVGSPMADLRKAYEQAKGKVDFAHIEADIDFSRIPAKQVMGGHFSTSPRLKIMQGTEQVGQNGSIRAQIELQAPDGIFYPKTNGQGYSTMTPDTWSLARAKGEMSNAWLNRSLVSGSTYQGMSSGVSFKFFAPNNTSVHLWRGYPEYTP
ncbi:polymorphic toxin-type HINT domain-containing protein [Duganella sp. CF458]|uniref:polymorphic toxin-type HINT domain-containing protein n=1 Tax=Duganella sp. CF458 TaxID=1884368 RepID=UPI001B8BA3D6|nr:polymorphic toxin-type HINT domain-containing protein [Duganella sp. CF458]